MDELGASWVLSRKMLRQGLAFMAVLVVLPVLAGCASDDKLEVYEERSVEIIYNKAADFLEAGDYREAAAEFDEVERQHPYSVWARRSMLMAAYAYYQVNEYDMAILSAQRFISLYPGNKSTAYARYLIAICFYEQISDVRRDQKITEQASVALLEVMRLYPDSKYARDARLKLDLTIEHLAGKEMEIGRYYMEEDNFIAAINRFLNVIKNYQTTNHVEEALHRLTESYLALGVISQAQVAAAVLGYNYPGSLWYQDSYALLADKGGEPEPGNQPDEDTEETGTEGTERSVF